MRSCRCEGHRLERLASTPGGGTCDLVWFHGGVCVNADSTDPAIHRAAEGELEEARDKAISLVWQAYTDVKLAISRLDVAAALIDASQQSDDATLDSYQLGLGTLIDLRSARRELSRAQVVELDTTVHVLNASAALACASGDWGPYLLTGRPMR